MNTGLDPELLTLSQDGYLVPASLFLNPPTRRHGRLNHISFDNAAVELRPHHTHQTSRLVRRLRKLYRSVRTKLGVAMMHGYIPPNSYLSLTPVAPLPSNMTDLPSVKIFGCSPSLTLMDDFSTFESKPTCSPDETRFRSAGFHIHQEISSPIAQAAVGVLDGVLGLRDVIENNKLGMLEFSRIRRNTLGYGRAGEFRTRRAPSGMTILEYRSLSPWPMRSYETVREVIQTTQSVCRQSPEALLSILDNFPDRSEITSVINNSNNSGAAKDLHKECLNALRYS